MLLPAPAFAAEGLNGAKLSILWALPFVGVLLCIATGPVFYPHVWEHHYGKFTAFWAALIVVPLFATADIHTVTTTLAHTALLEYMPFILLLLALFVVAGGIYLEGNLRDSVFTNTALLAVGAMMASIVGTTGASMILIRPLIRCNDNRRYNAHVVVFFIFLVANIGGALSPLGDPPLFIGFLKGVDFFWTTVHLWQETLVVGGIVLAIFMVIDLYMHHKEGRFTKKKDPTPDSPLRLHGKINLLLIGVIIAAILMSAQWKSGVSFFVAGVELRLQDLLRDVIFIVVTIWSLALTRKSDRAANGFSWGPIQEVAILFAGIFICIVPVMAMLQAGAQGPFAALLGLVTNADGSNNA
ncbi:MAG: sodium:proton antiporter, partial [Afipia sp.]